MLYAMSVEDNILFAKRNIIDSIYKEAKLEGVGGTFLDTKIVFEGGKVSGMKVDDIVTINNLKHAWQFILEHIDVPTDIAYVRTINSIVGSNLMLRPGELRTIDVSIGGTTWKPVIPDYDSVKLTLSRLQSDEQLETRILGTFAQICRGQWFYDGNKRTAQLIANKELISHGAGVFSIPVEQKPIWEEKLLDYYLTNDEKTFTDFLSDIAISGLNLPEPQRIDGLLTQAVQTSGNGTEADDIKLDMDAVKSIHAKTALLDDDSAETPYEFS